jgi:hypothetical protein
MTSVCALKTFPCLSSPYWSNMHRGQYVLPFMPDETEMLCYGVFNPFCFNGRPVVIDPSA